MQSQLSYKYGESWLFFRNHKGFTEVILVLIKEVVTTLCIKI